MRTYLLYYLQISDVLYFRYDLHSALYLMNVIICYAYKINAMN